MSVQVTTDVDADFVRNAHARPRWLLVAQTVWMVCAVTALIVFLAAIPLGYVPRMSGDFGVPIDAPVQYVAVMSIAQASVSVITALICLGLAALLFWSRRDEPMTLFVSCFLLGYGIALAGPLEALNGFRPAVQGTAMQGDAIISTSAILAIQSALFALMPLLFYLFPNGRFVPGWTRYAGLLSLFLVPGYIRVFSADWPATMTPFAWLVFGVSVFLLGAGIYAQIHRYRRVATPVEQQQSKWVVFGLVLTFVILSVLQIPYVILTSIPKGIAHPWWQPLTGLGWSLSLTILPISLAVAVMRYRLWEVDILINRTLVYGALTAFVAGMYILSVGAFGALFRAGESFAPLVFATVLVILLVPPLHRRLRHAANRLIPSQPIRGERIELERGVNSHAELRRRWQFPVYIAWCAGLALAVTVFLLALPGYAHLFTGSEMQAVDAPPPFVMLMRPVMALASIGIVALCLALAGLLFWRRRMETMALVTSFFLLAYGIAWGGALESALGAWQSEQGRILSSSIGSALTVVPTLLLLFLFPSGHFVPRWTRWVLPASLVPALLFLVVPPGVLNSFPFGWALDGALAVPVLIGLSAQIHRYRRVSSAIERQQTKGFVYGLFLAIGLGILASFAYPTILNTPSGVPLPWWALVAELAWIAAVAIIPLALTLAVLRYRLYDIDLIVNRTLVYGALTAFVIGIFVLVVALFGALFQTSGNLVMSLLATAAIAVLFQPLRERLQRGVNRLMYGERDDPYRVLTRLGAQLENAMEPSSALARTVEMVATALKLPYVAIALEQEGSMQTVAAHGIAPKAVSHFPLMHAGEPIGELVAAARTQNEALTSADERLLRDLARQIGFAARTVALTSDLEQARLRIVTERGEARRQLGSDLHDGVGHQLVGLTRQIESVTPKLPDSSALISSQFLADIRQRLVAMTTQVRSLAHQLYPPELEVLGLSGALRERVHVYSTFRILVDAPETLPPLPAEIETAAYYIALEALTNVDKHAQAKVCHIRLRLSSADSTSRQYLLELDIVDDGRGFGASATHGLGLLSMQARAAEIGGFCHIVPNPGGGTAVRVQIPCVIKGT